jgi:molybdopterin molybdotransferase
VRIKAAAKPRQNVAPRASDAKTGEVLIRAGTLISPAEVGVLAAVGCADVPVRRLPSTAILGTGDEIVEPHVNPGPAQIRNSNSHQLLAQCAANFIPARYLGIAPDDRAATRKLIDEGLKSELFISTGGVSVGDHDHVGAAFKELGVQIFFDKVAIKPGKPTTFGVWRRRDVETAGRGDAETGRREETRSEDISASPCLPVTASCLVFGLPGNPVAAWVCFHLFVLTAARVHCGANDPLPRWHTLPLLDATGGAGDRTTFRPCKLVLDNGVTKVKPIDWHGSGHLSALVGADGLFVQNVGADLLAGQGVTFYPV